MKRGEYMAAGTADYVEWLVSKGCRFYAPMDQEHGLSELIQGWTPSIRTGETVSFDQDKKSYRLTLSSNDYATMMWTEGTIQPEFVGQTAKNTIYTMICSFNLTSASATWEAEIVYGGGDNYYLVLGGTSSSRNSIVYTTRQILIRNGKTFNFNQWYTLVCLRNGPYYQNKWFNQSGVLEMLESGNSTWALVYNQNMDTHVSAMMGCTGYIKNAYIFNTALSDNDIEIIYQHDHQ